MAYVEYIKDDEKITLFKTEIPESIAKIDDSVTYLINKIVESCRDDETKLEFYCPFAKAVMDRMRIQSDLAIPKSQ